jgi:hypothetical protein
VANRVLVAYLRCLAGDRPKSWLRWLAWAEYCFNTSYQTALRATPFQVVYGREPPAVVPFLPGSAKVAAVDRQLQDRDAFLADIRERLLQAQDQMKEGYDARHRDLEFVVGDWVWLRLQRRMAVAIKEDTPHKLTPKYFGPYQVLARIGPVSCKLKLPAKARIHDVFHVVNLKKFTGTPPAMVVPLPHIVRGRVVLQPAKILRARSTKDSWELLVRWDGHHAADATWVLLETFKNDYPDFKLEDELFRQTGGSVVDSFFGKQYRRQRRAGATESG